MFSLSTVALTFGADSWPAAASGTRRTGGRIGGRAGPRGRGSCPGSPAPTAAPRSPRRQTWSCTGDHAATRGPSTLLALRKGKNFFLFRKGWSRYKPLKLSEFF